MKSIPLRQDEMYLTKILLHTFINIIYVKHTSVNATSFRGLYVVVVVYVFFNMSKYVR